jgi:hypothetical protein
MGTGLRYSEDSSGEEEFEEASRTKSATVRTYTLTFSFKTVSLMRSSMRPS